MWYEMYTWDILRLHFIWHICFIRHIHFIVHIYISYYILHITYTFHMTNAIWQNSRFHVTCHILRYLHTYTFHITYIHFILHFTSTFHVYMQMPSDRISYFILHVTYYVLHICLHLTRKPAFPASSSKAFSCMMSTWSDDSTDIEGFHVTYHTSHLTYYV
jgi:hypothetical protein